MKRKKQKIQNKNRSGKRQKQVNKEEKQKNKGKNKPKRIKKYQFKYIGKIDAFECPKTKKLFEVVDIVTLTGVKKKKYTCDYCISCKYKSECTSQYRRILYEHYDENMEEIRRFYYSDEGQEIYFQRGHFAESSFAILLESRNFRGIKTRGIENVNMELTFYEIHHNIKKYEKLTTNKFLRLLFHEIKREKEKTGNIDFIFIEKISKKLIIKNGVIKEIRD